MATESTVLKSLIRNAIARGYLISVHDGEEWAVVKSKDATAIFEAATATDESNLRFRLIGGEFIGTVYLVFGNSPEELIADYSDNDAIRALVDSVEV